MRTDKAKKLTLPIAAFPGFQLRAASNATWARLSNILEEFDVRVTEASILIVIQANPGCRQSEVGQTLNIVSANMTPTLHRLEKRGLITRTPVDGRTNALDLTKLGQKTASSCFAAMEEFESFLVRQIKPTGRDRFNAAMLRITEALKD